LPGDVNNDDLIENNTPATDNIRESLYFWRELLEENLIGNLRYNPSNNLTNNDIIAGVTIPSSKYDRTVGWHAMYLYGDISSNVLILSGFDNNKLLPLIKSHTAQSVDTKIDDGKPLTGAVYMNKNSSEDYLCYSDNEYNLDNESIGNCSVIFAEKSLPDHYTNADVEENINVDVMAIPSGFRVFNYTGTPQTFVVPNGIEEIVIEVWGAQGGNGSNRTGGAGGYSTGILEVTSGKILYVYVGEQKPPIDPLAYTYTPGGWNGGGVGCATGGYGFGNGGGGGTDVRTIDGAWNNAASLNNRVIVAGGGGGGGIGGYGYVGGGENGGGGSMGGTQTSGGIGLRKGGSAPGNGGFGVGGGSGAGNGKSNGMGGGGGGWYGGGGSDNATNSGGGGGSGYVGGVTDGHTESGKRSGNGIARICWGDKVGECNGTQPKTNE
jgi:hypothetical protein